MNIYLLDDESVDTIQWSSMIKATHLDLSKTYQKLLNEINSCLDPRINLSLDLDYESMRLLINQAREYNMPFVNSNNFLALMISKNNHPEVKKRLYEEEGYNKSNRTSKIIDHHLYKKVCNNLDGSIDLEDIQTHRRAFLEELLNDDLLPLEIAIMPERYCQDQDYYFDIHFNKKDSYATAETLYLDLISEYFFDDYYQNAFLDARQIIKYVGLTNNEKIPQERLDFYENFINLKEQTNEERLEFFNTFKGLNMIEQFYDDIRILKDESYKSLVDSCTQFTKVSPLYNKELSQRYGCDIYYLDGEEFYGFVRSDVRINKYDISHESGSPQLVKCPQPTPEQIARLGSSFTYIGKDDIQTFQNPNEKLTMLYRGIRPETIGHVYHNDSWTNPNYYHYSDYQNELHTPDSLLQESIKYPEILITDLKGIEPIALVCLDAVTEWDIEFSKKNNLPIVLINSLKYERKYEQEDYFENHYTR